MQSIAANQLSRTAPLPYQARSSQTRSYQTQPYQTLWGEQSQTAAEFEALLIGYLTLSNLIDDNRWITLVAGKCVDLQRIKRSCGRHQRLRIIQAGAEDLLWISWQCLAQGNSQTVIAVLEDVSMTEREHLQDAATLGCSALQLIQGG